MSTDPVAYDSLRPSLCRACIDKQNWAMLLTGYCMHARCTGCGEIRDLAMVKLDRPLKQNSKTGTQNRPYQPGTLMVRATFRWEQDEMGVTSQNQETLTFNWNNRDEVRNFAAQSDSIIRMGGSTLLEKVK